MRMPGGDQARMARARFPQRAGPRMRRGGETAGVPPLLFPIAATYVFLFLGRGVMSPFTPLWLESHGLAGFALALALAAPGLARPVIAPAIVAGVDRFPLQRTGIALLALLCAAALAMMALAPTPWLLALCWFVAASASAAAQPLTDVAALSAAREKGWTYGRLRSLGSAAYAVANLAGGALVRLAGPVAAILWSIGANVATGLAARSMTPVSAPPRSPAGSAVLARGFWRIAAPLGLIQGAHAFFYGYGTLVWRDQGLDGVAIGLLWSVAVGSEILFLSLAETARRHWGDWGLMRISAVAGVVRWLGAALLPGLGWQMAAQALHGLSFSAAFFAALHLLDGVTPPDRVRSAQSVCAGFAGGFCVGAITLGCGALRDAFGSGGFLVMALIAALALPMLAARPPAPQAAAPA